jgi:hypothetical protein
MIQNKKNYVEKAKNAKDDNKKKEVKESQQQQKELKTI